MIFYFVKMLLYICKKFILNLSNVLKLWRRVFSWVKSKQWMEEGEHTCRGQHGMLTLKSLTAERLKVQQSVSALEICQIRVRPSGQMLQLKSSLWLGAARMKESRLNPLIRLKTKAHRSDQTQQIYWSCSQQLAHCSSFFYTRLWTSKLKEARSRDRAEKQGRGQKRWTSCLHLFSDIFPGFCLNSSSNFRNDLELEK